MEHHSSSSLFNLTIDPLTKSHLTEAAKWARFLAIIGMVSLVLMVLFGIFFSTLMGKTSNPFEGAAPDTNVSNFIGIGMAILYIVLAVIWFFPLLYLLRFANTLKVALNNNDQTALNVGFQNLKACFRYVGIFTIIILVIYTLIFSIAIFGDAASMF